MDFIINNLAVLLTVLALTGTVGFFWACRTLKTGTPCTGTWTSVTTGRMSCQSPNYSNVPKSIPTRVGLSTMEYLH